MYFLNSIAFWGTAGAIGVATPIIIHLLNRRKFERVQWAAMRFIQQAIQQNQRRIQIEDIILLIIRCVMIALIALALARPTISASIPSLGEATSAVIILDVSGSMSARDGAETRFTQAKKFAEQMLDVLPPKSEVSVVLVADSIPAVIPDPTPDLAAVRKEIMQAQQSDRGSNIVPAIKKGLEILSKTNSLRKELITISDSQRLGWRQTAEIRSLIEENKKDVHATLVFVGDMPEKNLAITDLRLDSEIPAVNRQLRFMAQVTNYSLNPTKSGEAEVSLTLDGDAKAVTKVALGELKGGESQSVLLTARFDKEGYHTVTASLPDDPIPSGNSRSVAFHVVKQVQVLVVDGEPALEPRDSKAFYIASALRTDRFIEVDVQSTTEFVAQRRLEDYDVIFLANVAELPATFLPSLERYVKNSGGGLAVFPGANANVKFYNEQLFANRNLIPAGLGEALGEAENETRFFTFQTGNYSHPIVSMWSKPERGNPANARFFRIWDLIPPKPREKNAPDSLTGESRVVLNYNTGRPAVMERTLGTGRTIIFSSGADTKWNDLPVASGGKIFVPLVMHTVGSLVGREDELYNVRAGQRLSIPQPSDRIGHDVTISLQGDDKYPVQASRVEITGGIGAFRFDSTNRAGVYNAVIGAGASAETLKFAVSPDNEESSIDPLVPAQSKEFEDGGAKVIRWVGEVNLTETFKRAQQGTEIWIYFALPALLLAAVETYLAHIFSKPK
jgi:hypothetical protein